MRSPVQRPLQAGFTLVELLIVVIILSVLAAIIVPQFSSATMDAKEAALDANLARIRSAVELFHAQHNNIYPGATATGDGGACNTNGTKGTATAAGAQALLDHLLMYSDANGNTCTVGDATTFKYGPYLRKGMPNDSITGKGAALADLSVVGTGAPLAATGTDGGWRYDWKSGQIIMNSTANDTKTKPYATH